MHIVKNYEDYGLQYDGFLIMGVIVLWKNLRWAWS